MPACWSNGADLIGDSWVYLVVAHEWGHAIQARLEDDLVATAEELQADCLGAAAMYGAVADRTLELEPGDDQELIGSLTTLADQMPWTMSRPTTVTRSSGSSGSPRAATVACPPASSRPDGRQLPSAAEDAIAVRGDTALTCRTCGAGSGTLAIGRPSTSVGNQQGGRHVLTSVCPGNRSATRLNVEHERT